MEDYLLSNIKIFCWKVHQMKGSCCILVSFLVFFFLSLEKGEKCCLHSSNPVRKVKKLLVTAFFKTIKKKISWQLKQDCNKWNRAIFLQNFHLWRAHQCFGGQSLKAAELDCCSDCIYILRERNFKRYDRKS